jgi:hypothetical protein
MPNRRAHAPARSHSTLRNVRGRSPSVTRGLPVSRTRGRSRTRKQITAGQPTLFQKQKNTVPGMAGCATFSTHTKVHRMSKFHKLLIKDLGNQTYITNGTTYVSAGNNLQAIYNLIPAFTYPTMKAIYDRVMSYTTLNTNQQQKIIWGHASITYYMMNPTNAPISIDIYDLEYRHDMPERDPNGETGSVNEPSALWYDGGVNMNSGYDVTIFGATPFQSAEFTQNIKVRKVTRVQLAEGGQHEHRVRVEANRSINQAFIENVGDYWYRNLSYACMIVGKGSPINTADSNHIVVSSPVGINIVQTVKYNYYQVLTNKPDITISNQMRTSDAPLKVMNVGDGQADTFTSA